MHSPTIAVDDPRAPDVRALIEHHHGWATSQTPPEDAHALDADSLADPSVTFISLRNGGRLLGIGAIKRLDAHHVELKSMHTVEGARGQGVGRAILDHLLGIAADLGARRVSLETGSMEAFAAARALYATARFTECEPFGDYRPSRNSSFMTLYLEGSA